VATEVNALASVAVFFVMKPPMLARIRFKLHFGPYRTPKFKLGQRVIDIVRGEVEIVGIRDAKIPWPVGKRGRFRALILYADLAKAVRNESVVAICHWFGVKPSTVNKWRRALGVGALTPGTHALRVEHTKEPWAKAAIKKAQSKVNDPGRRAKQSAAMRGRTVPKYVAKKIRAALLGQKISLETRRKMSEARQGMRPCGRRWTPEQDQLVLPTSSANTWPDDRTRERR
jgi:transposase-like protein